MSKGLFKAPQLTGEKKPTFGSVDEALAGLLVVAGFCELLFGNRAALGRCKKYHATPIPCEAQFVTGSTKCVWSKQDNGDAGRYSL
jgi:hypothetical protein